MPIVRLVLPIFILCISAVNLLNAQQPDWRDSLNARVRLLHELIQDDNYEQAQIEAGALRNFLRREYVFCPPAVVPVISRIYAVNRDRQSVVQFLAECERDAQRDKNLDNKLALLKVIAQEHTRWEETERAASVSQLIKAVEDSLVARKFSAHTIAMQRRNDSLQNELTMLQTQRKDVISLERDRAVVLAVALGLTILALLLYNQRIASRWKAKFKRREIEWDLQRGAMFDQNQSVEKAVEETAITTTSSAYQNASPFGEYGVTQTALVIEPNRQIALYIRSLLNDRFEVDMANSATEGLKKAGETLPDLIVCDTALDTQTGIDITRQIKLNERTNHIPVVLLSNYHGNEGRLDALRAGADAWFTRPVLDIEFGQTVKQLLEGRAVQHEQFNRFLQLYFTESRIELKNAFLENVVRLIENNLGAPDYFPDDLARQMQMSNLHFVKKLRALTGKDPARLLREMRLEKARYLLEKRAGSPQAIAHLTGFDNAGAFAMAFKEYFGENTLLLYGGKRED